MHGLTTCQTVRHFIPLGWRHLAAETSTLKQGHVALNNRC
jgi:hypothetical protein